MAKIYICSAYREGNVQENLENMKKYCRVIYFKFKHMPIAPHLYFSSIFNEDNEAERNAEISASLELMKDCDSIYVIGEITEEMKKEMEFAHMNQRFVTYFKYDEKEDFLLIYRPSDQEKRRRRLFQ